MSRFSTVLLACLAVNCASALLHAQAQPRVDFEYRSGNRGSHFTNNRALMESANGDLLLSGGRFNGNVDGQATYEGFVSRFGSGGEIRSEHAVPNTRWISWLIERQDQGLILSGVRSIGAEIHPVITSMSADGQIEWQATLDEPTAAYVRSIGWAEQDALSGATFFVHAGRSENVHLTRLGSDGSIQWSRGLPMQGWQYPGSFVISGDTLIVQARNVVEGYAKCVFMGVSALSGELLWQMAPEVQGVLPGGCYGTHLTSDGRLRTYFHYVAADGENLQLASVDVSGQLQLHPSYILPYSSFDIVGVVVEASGEVLFLASADQNLVLTALSTLGRSREPVVLMPDVFDSHALRVGPSWIAIVLGRYFSAAGQRMQSTRVRFFDRSGVALQGGYTELLSTALSPNLPFAVSGRSGTSDSLGVARMTMDLNSFSGPLDRIAIGIVSPPVAINFGMTGSWFNPAIPGQGLIIEVIPGVQPPVLAAGWFTYDTSGERPPAQRWFSAQGAFEEGANSVTLDLFQSTGGVLGQTNPVSTEVVGSAEIRFDSCTEGRFSYFIDDMDPGHSVPNRVQGSFAIQRLTPDVVCASLNSPPSH